MITPQEMREIRQLRGLSLRDVARYCNVSAQLIGQVETGVKHVTDYNYREIVDGMNRAYAAKQR